MPSFELCLVPRLLMGGDRVVSGKALKARGSLDGWQEDTGDDREREHRKRRATLNTQECEPLYECVYVHVFIHFTSWSGWPWARAPQGAVREATHKRRALQVQDPSVPLCTWVCFVSNFPFL